MPTSKPFEPAWWCRGPHMQTLWPTLIRRRPQVRLRHERLELPDGDFIDLQWTEARTGPIVIILHGLEGSSNSAYARGLLKALQRDRIRAVVMHFRGCSGSPNRLPRSYHSGDTADLAYLVKILKQREPDVKIAAVGYSLGGNVLLKWLGETGKRNSLISAVAISVPFLLTSSADRMNKGFSKVYQWKLLRSLRQKIKQKLKRMPLQVRTYKLGSLRNFRAFDDAVTAPLHGFNDAEHYYASASSRQYLRDINVDTLILHARDDPFMTDDTIPTAAELSDSTTLELYPYGGHVGFVAGTWPWRTDYWLEIRIVEHLVPRLMLNETATAQYYNT